MGLPKIRVRMVYDASCRACDNDDPTVMVVAFVREKSQHNISVTAVSSERRSQPIGCASVSDGATSRTGRRPKFVEPALDPIVNNFGRQILAFVLLSCLFRSRPFV